MTKSTATQLLEYFSESASSVEILRLLPIILEANLIMQNADIDTVNTAEDMSILDSKLNDILEVPQEIVTKVIQTSADNNIFMDTEFLNSIKETDIPQDKLIEVLTLALWTVLYITLNPTGEYFKFSIDNLREDMSDLDYLTKCFELKDTQLH